MLNNRQKELLEYLIEHKNEYVSKVRICKDLPMAYPRHLENHNNEGNKSIAFKNISVDVRTINESAEIDYIIIFRRYKGYKLGNEEEILTYIKNRFKRDLKALKLDWQLVRKNKLDHQLYFDKEEIKEIKTYIGE